MIINKWFFKNFKEDITNFIFLKTIPFCIFSDLKNPQYDLLQEFFDKIGFDKTCFLSIGKKQAPFGITLLPDDNKTYNTLLNSCRFSFVLTTDIDETDYLLKSIMAGIVPICHEDHVFVKNLGLQRYTSRPSVDYLNYTLNEILDKKHIVQYHIWKLSQKYRCQYNKWQNE